MLVLLWVLSKASVIEQHLVFLGQVARTMLLFPHLLVDVAPNYRDQMMTALRTGDVEHLGLQPLVSGVVDVKTEKPLAPPPSHRDLPRWLWVALG